MNDPLFYNRLRQVLLLIVIIALGGVLIAELSAFIPGFLGAITVYILSRERYNTLTTQKKWGKSKTALLFILLFLVGVGIPVWLAIQLLSPQVSLIFNNSDEVLIALKSVSAQIKAWTGFELFTDQNIKQLLDEIARSIPSFLSSGMMIFSNFVMIIFLWYYMLVHGVKMESTLAHFIPLKPENIHILEAETINMIKANAIGIPVVAFIQGLFALIGYWIFGIPNYVLWGFVTGIMSLVPVVGTGLIFFPLSIYLLSSGQIGQGIGLAIYSLIVTGNVDYFARITLLKKIGDVHPIITALGIVMGLNLFGFWGIVFGPLLISYLMLLFKIYKSEFGFHPKPELTTEQTETLFPPDEEIKDR